MSHIDTVENHVAPGPTTPGAGSVNAEQRAQHLAAEAVLGTLAHGRGVDEQSVCEWITAALGKDEAPEEEVKRAMFFVRRMLYGPLPLGS